jgi:hypothetical protein
MNLFIQKLSYLKILRPSDYCFFIGLYLINVCIRLIISFGSFNTMARWLGHSHKCYQLSSIISEEQMNISRRISLIIKIIEKSSPWHTKCLAQAILARTILGFYRIPYVVHLGATLHSNQKITMKAHAWIKVGNRIVTGKEGHRTFTIVGTFIDKSIIDNITL